MSFDHLPWDESIDQAARKLWDYHRLNHPLEPADLILILGSHDLRVGDRAAELFHENMAPRLCFTGGYGNWTRGHFERPEAEMIAERAIACGVPASVLIKEPRASNTGENIQFSKELLAQHGWQVQRAIAIQKPYMERRAWASLCCQWPEVQWQVTSPQMSFDDYCHSALPPRMVAEVMVGDLQRIMAYPKLGYQTEQPVSDEVHLAYSYLIERGFVGHMMHVS